MRATLERRLTFRAPDKVVDALEEEASALYLKLGTHIRGILARHAEGYLKRKKGAK